MTVAGQEKGEGELKKGKGGGKRGPFSIVKAR